MLNALVPKFIKNIDRYFLLNHPVLWISKIHYVLYYATIMWLFSGLVGMVVPVNLSQPQDIALWHVLFTVLAIVLFCIWIYRNAIFNVEKKFGNRHWTDEFKLFFLYFISVFIFFSFGYPFAMVYNGRIANTVTTPEFIEDINTLNRAEPFIPVQFYNYYNYYDSTRQVTYYDINRRVTFGGYTPYAVKGDTLLFGNLKSEYRLYLEYRHDKQSDEAILAALRHRNLVMEKYGLGADIIPAEVLKTYKFLCKSWQTDKSNQMLAETDYDYSITRMFDNISEAKFKPIFLFRTDFLLFVFYFTLYITLFFLLFRNTQWQHFLITIITLIVLPILLFIIGQVIPREVLGSRDIIFDTATILVFLTGLVFTIQALAGGRVFSAFKNITMQLFYVLVPVMPMYIVSYLKNHTGVFHYAYDYTHIYETVQDVMTTNAVPGVYERSPAFFLQRYLNEYWQQQYDLWFAIMQVAGILLFVIVVLPFMKGVFVKQMALPRHR